MHFIFYDYFRCCYVRANAAELLARFASNSVAGWSGFGASGVVYSAIGLCTASAVMNSCDLLIRYVRSFRDPDIKETVPEIVIMALNLTLIVLALYLILFARDLFLNASPGIDVFRVHRGLSDRLCVLFSAADAAYAPTSRSSDSWIALLSSCFYPPPIPGSPESPAKCQLIAKADVR